MKQRDIDILPDQSIVLVLHEGPLHQGMSTFEAKRFAMDQYFGSLLAEVKRLADLPDRETAISQIVLQVREALEVLR